MDIFTLRNSDKEAVKSRLPEYLDYKGIAYRDDSNGDCGGKYVPFKCINPEHHDTASEYVDCEGHVHKPNMVLNGGTGKSVHCFRCGATYDIFDCVRLLEGLKSYDEAEAWLADFFGYELAPLQPEGSTTKPHHESGKGMSDSQRSAALAVLKEAGKDADCARDYFSSRGIPEAVWRGKGCGYVRDYRGYGPAVIIPKGDAMYQARLITPPQGAPRYMNGAGTPSQLAFWDDAVFSPEAGCVFITEGPFDAMSVEAVGGKACAISSASCTLSAVRLLARAADRLDELCGTICFLLDNDSAGRTALAYIASSKAVPAALRERVIFAEIPQETGCKDANEVLLKDSSLLASIVNEPWKYKAETIVAGICESQAEEDEAPAFSWEDCSSTGLIARHFAALLEDDFAPVPTGLKTLDMYLGGGLSKDMYVLGAVPSLGKTDLCLQIADTIAAGGVPVLFFELESTAGELLYRSVVRCLAEEHVSKAGWKGTVDYPPATAFMSGGGYRSYGKKGIIERGIELYEGKVNGNVYIFDSTHGRPTASSVASKVEGFIAETGRTPVVFLDYLQYLQPESEKLSDKQAIDMMTSILKESCVKRGAGYPLVMVSSFNRAGYGSREGEGGKTEPWKQKRIGMDSFKESGLIEYTAGGLLGMTYYKYSPHMDGNFLIRDISLQVIKNRRGPQCLDGIRLFYNPALHIYTEEEPLEKSELSIAYDSVNLGDCRERANAAAQKKYDNAIAEKTANALHSTPRSKGR